MEVLLLQYGYLALVFHLKMWFGMQRYAFIEGFPSRSGEDFQADNHSFSDGNKRIAATLFLWFMENNRILYAKDGHKRIADNALVALTLMIAESKTDEMDIMAYSPVPNNPEVP